MNDEDRLRALRVFELDDVPSLSEGRQDIMETIEQRLKELATKARTKAKTTTLFM